MIGLVGKDIKNIIITHDFHTSKKLQKRMNKLSRGMELDRERNIFMYAHAHTALQLQTLIPEIKNTLERIKRRLDNTEK